jgi:hypothetical protein
MIEELCVKVKLVGKFVNAPKSPFSNIPLLNFQKGPINQTRAERSLEIVKNSLLGYPVKDLYIDDNNHFVATLKGPISEFIRYDTGYISDIYFNILTALANHYGNGAADTWMEDNIYVNSRQELWLDLVSVEFYKNNQLYLLFDNLHDLESLGRIPHHLYQKQGIPL